MRQKPSVLYQPWLYLVLGAIAVIVYAWPLMSGLPRASRAHQAGDAERRSPSASRQAAGAEEFWGQELRPAQLLARLRDKPNLAVVLGLWTVAVTGLGVGGVILGVRAVLARRLGRIFRYRSRIRRFWSLRDVARIFILLILVVGLLPFASLVLIASGVVNLADPNLRNVFSTLVVDGLLLFIVWAFATTKTSSPAAVLGLSVPRAGAIRQAWVGYVAVFPWIFGLLWFIVRVCQQLGIEPPLEPIHELLFLDERKLIIGLTVVLACVVGPVVEEIFFRGLVFVAVRRHASRLVAMLASGALFAAMHTNLIGFLPILLLGCFLADLYERTGSLVGPIVVHIFHNTLLIGIGLTVKELMR